MSILSQKTIKSKISFEGVGVHTGLPVKMSLLPSAPNTGIIFKRVDIKKNNEVVPNFANVCDATLCTTVSNNFGVKVSTIEHLMGALFGLGVDNLVVELNSQEVPILDGSAKEFVENIIKVGFVETDVPIKIIKIKNEIKVNEGNKFISISKSNINLDIDFEIKYDNQVINKQRNKINVFNDDLTNIYNSRTFCLFEDIENLKKMGLGKGGSLKNAVVVKDQKILNIEGLRNNLEFVNHKILDCIGDLYLSGYRIIGSVKCSQGGHRLTNKLLRKVFENTDNYSLIEIKGKNLPHSLSNYQALRSIA